MNKRHSLLLFQAVTTVVMSFVLSGIAPASASEPLSIRDFGLKPDTRENAVPAVKQALASCADRSDMTLVFPRGRYDFFAQDCPEKTYHESNTTDTNPKRCPILLEHLKGITIDGSGSDFIFHGQMQPFTVDHSEKVLLQNVNVDWDIPLTAQGEVVASESDHMDLRIDPVESPFAVENERLVFTGEDWKSPWWGVMEFERGSRLIPPGTGDETLGGGWIKGGYRTEKLGDDLVRIHKHAKNMPKKGNFLVLRHNERIHSGIFLFHSKDVQVRNVNLYNTGGLGVLGQFTENIDLDNTNVIPNAAKHRYLSGHDDGAHFSNCRGQVTVENCSFAGLMDDPINVHGTCVRIIEKRADNRLLCRFMHEQSVGLEWGRSGETVGFIEHEGMCTIGTGTLAAFNPSGLTDFEVTFNGTVPADTKEGDALENLTWAPDVLLRNNRFGSCRARGVLISTPGRVVIEENVFESSGSAILVAGDANEHLQPSLSHQPVPVLRGHNQHLPGDPQTGQGTPAFPPQHPCRGEHLPSLRLSGAVCPVHRRADVFQQHHHPQQRLSALSQEQAYDPAGRLQGCHHCGQHASGRRARPRRVCREDGLGGSGRCGWPGYRQALETPTRSCAGCPEVFLVRSASLRAPHNRAGVGQ
jgi:hypothetical protein